MTKPVINYIQDVIMGISFVITAWSSILLGFIMERGQGAQPFWGIARHTWYEIHQWSGVVFIALVLLHLILHWKWIAVMTKRVILRKP